MSDSNLGRGASAEELQARGLAASMRADPALAALVGLHGFDSQAALAAARMHHMHQLSQLGGLGDLALLQSFQGGPGLLGQRPFTSAFDEPTRKLSRTEKKRNREQQRRHEVNEGFDSLIDLLRRIEPRFRTGSRKPAFSAGADMDEHTITNRVDLLDYTMHLIQSLHDDNEKKKERIKELIAEKKLKSEAKSDLLEVVHRDTDARETKREEDKKNDGTNEDISTAVESKDKKKKTKKTKTTKKKVLTLSRSEGMDVNTPVAVLGPIPESLGLRPRVVRPSDGAAITVPIGSGFGAGEFETAMGLLGSRLGGPSVLEMANARSSHGLAVQRALMASNPLLLQRDAAAFLGSGAAATLAAHQQQQLFTGLPASPSLAYHQLLMGAGASLAGMKRTPDDDCDNGEKGLGETMTKKKK